MFIATKSHALTLTLSMATLALASCGGGEGACAEAHATAAATTGGEAEGTFPLSEPLTAPASLTVTSTDFEPNGRLADAQVFSGFGCTGGNVSPSIAWSGAPEGTQSFAIVAHDPDAPTGVGFFHWLVFNIPSSTTSLPAGAASALPEGAISARTDFGTNTYGGPCPPPGDPHRYGFTVYALDVPTLGADANASGALLRFMLVQHTLAYGRLVGTYGR